MSALRTLAVAAALLTAVALPGLAAEPDNSGAGARPGWGYGMMGGYGAMWGPGGGFFYGRGNFGMGPWMMGGMWGFTDEDAAVNFVDGRLAFLKAELKITERQMPEWTTFAEAMRANAKAINERVRTLRGGNWATKPLPERLAEQEKVLTARLEAFRHTSAAVKPLYAVLDDAQKKIADVILLGPMGGFHGQF